MSESQSDSDVDSVLNDGDAYDGLESEAFSETERRERQAIIRQLKVAIHRLADPETEVTVADAWDEPLDVIPSWTTHENEGGRDVAVRDLDGSRAMTKVVLEFSYPEKPDVLYEVSHGTEQERRDGEDDVYEISSMSDLFDLPDEVRDVVGVGEDSERVVDVTPENEGDAELEGDEADERGD